METFGVGILVFLCAGFLFTFFMIFKLNVELYFLSFKFEMSRKIMTLTEEILNKIVKREKIGVFNKDYEEVNKGKELDERVVGQYIYTFNEEYQKKCNDFLHQIEKEEIFTTHDKEEITLPRIILCEKHLKENGLMCYYSTYLHELGHHYASKSIGKHDENDADKFAYQIVETEFPRFFKLFFVNWFSIRNKGIKLTEIERMKCYISYLKYIIKNGRN